MGEGIGGNINGKGHGNIGKVAGKYRERGRENIGEEGKESMGDRESIVDGGQEKYGGRKEERLTEKA